MTSRGSLAKLLNTGYGKCSQIILQQVKLDTKRSIFFRHGAPAKCKQFQIYFSRSNWIPSVPSSSGMELQHNASIFKAVYGSSFAVFRIC